MWSHSPEENFLRGKTSCTGKSARTWMLREFQRKLSHITPCCCTHCDESQLSSVHGLWSTVCQCESKGGFYFTKQLEVGWPSLCCWRSDTNLSTGVEYHWILECMAITTGEEVPVPETFFTTIGHLTKFIQFMNFDKKNWVNNSCKKNFARKVTKYGT